MTVLQTSPNLGLTLRMQRASAPVATSGISGGDGGDGQIDGVSWFSPIFDGWWVWYWDELPDGRWEVIESDGGIQSIWEGDPQVELPVPTSTFRCVEITARSGIAGGNSTHHVGVVQGSSMTDVRWEAAWDAPSAGDPTVSAGIGNRFWTWGNVIVVEQLSTGGAGGPGGTNWTETLIATAYSGSTVVGELTLHSFHPAY